MMGKHDEMLSDARMFMRSRPILTAAELDLFTRLDEKPASGRELAEGMKLDTRALTRLLDCLVTFGLLTKSTGQYRPTEKGALLSSRHPESVLPMVLHMNQLWDSWSHLTETVRQGTNPARKPFSQSAHGMEAFIGAMHVVGRDLAVEIADAYDASVFKRLLDIGGGSGTYTIAFLRKNPHMTAALFDRDEVVAMADKRLKAEGLRERVELVAGDFYHDELPGGCDLAILSAIIHQNSPQENLDLYRKILRALAPGGALLIRDHVMDEARTTPPAGALFALNMLVNTSGGDTYTFEEIKRNLEEAGFADVKELRRGEKMDCLVEGRKPR